MTRLPNPNIKGGELVTTPCKYKTMIVSTYWDNEWHHLCLVPRKTILVEGKKVESLHPKSFSESSLKLGHKKG